MNGMEYRTPWRARTTRVLATIALGTIVVGSSQCLRAQTPAARAATGDLARIAKAVTPAVVSIESEFSAAATARMEQQEQGIPPGLLPPQMQPRGPSRAGGTGFFIRPDGYILTNNHVVSGASRVTVTLPDRRIYTARVVGHDPSTDVALIKIDGSGFPTLPLGDDSTAQVGDGVLAVGNPLGLDFTVTAGIISAKGRSGGLRSLFASDYAVVDFIQTDAVINPGNSGGPLIDMQGRVIGINSAIESPTGVYAGYGFAIPIGLARLVMNQLMRYGHVRRAILGISLQDVTPADARAAGMQQIRGALVGGFSGPDTPARRAGVRIGDVILSVDGRSIDRVSQLQRMIFGYQPGQTVTLGLERYGTQHEVRVTLGEAPTPPDTAQVATTTATHPGGRLGVEVTPLTPDMATQLHLAAGTQGLLVGSVDPAGPSAESLFPHDVITATLGPDGSQNPVRGVQDLQRAIDGARDGIVSLLVARPQGTWVENIQINR